MSTNNYDNEMIINFSTEEAPKNKHMEFIDNVFNNMSKDDAKEAMKGLVSIMLKRREEDREIIAEYDALLETTYNALIVAINKLNDKDNK